MDVPPRFTTGGVKFFSSASSFEEAAAAAAWVVGGVRAGSVTGTAGTGSGSGVGVATGTGRNVAAGWVAGAAVGGGRAGSGVGSRSLSLSLILAGSVVGGVRGSGAGAEAVGAGATVATGASAGWVAKVGVMAATLGFGGAEVPGCIQYQPPAPAATRATTSSANRGRRLELELGARDGPLPKEGVFGTV